MWRGSYWRQRHRERPKVGRPFHAQETKSERTARSFGHQAPRGGEGKQKSLFVFIHTLTGKTLELNSPNCRPILPINLPHLPSWAFQGSILAGNIHETNIFYPNRSTPCLVLSSRSLHGAGRRGALSRRPVLERDDEGTGRTAAIILGLS